MAWPDLSTRWKKYARSTMTASVIRSSTAITGSKPPDMMESWMNLSIIGCICLSRVWCDQIPWRALSVALLALLRRWIERHAVALHDALDLTALQHLLERFVDELQQLFLFRLHH